MLYFERKETLAAAMFKAVAFIDLVNGDDKLEGGKLGLVDFGSELRNFGGRRGLLVIKHDNIKLTSCGHRWWGFLGAGELVSVSVTSCLTNYHPCAANQAVGC